MAPHRVFIIAEAGVNHNGSLELAKRLVDVAAEAGADAVKFQTFKAEELASTTAPKAQYQLNTTGDSESQYEMLKRLELSREMHFALLAYCQTKNIQFLSTPFDLNSADFLINELDVPKIKMPSGEITTAPLLLKVARSGKPIILSTGMATLGEIEVALGVLAFGYLKLEESPSIAAFNKAYSSPEGQQLLKNRVTLLHCTSEYPAPFSSINLNAMRTLENAFGLPVGYSDHSVGTTVAIAAVAKGAVLIEKHFTIDHHLPGPDHHASLMPDELSEMIKAIRIVEQALGTPTKCPAAAEFSNRAIVRKSLVALCTIKKSELFSEKNIGMKRPGTGISPLEYWEILGSSANCDYAAGDIIRG